MPDNITANSVCESLAALQRSLIEDREQNTDQAEPVYYGILARSEFEPYIVEDAMFLTRRAADEHLARNAYNYSGTAKSFAMTAWRNPEFGDLLKAIKAIDFEKSTIVLKGDGTEEPRLCAGLNPCGKGAGRA